MKGRLPSIGITISLASAIAIALSGCGADELEVSYLYIPEISVATDTATEPDGIAAVRAVLGAQSLGFYPVPARIPILATGPQTIRIEPAVRRSGLSEDIRVYPLYEAFVRDLSLGVGRTDTLRPVFGYTPNTVVGLDEGFETAGTRLLFDLVAEGSAPLLPTEESPRAGRASGLITLTLDKPVYEVASAVITPNRAQLLDLWVELDFRGDVALSVALLPEEVPSLPPNTARAARYFQGALPRADWTKLYFDIVDASNDSYLATGFRVSLLAVYDPTIGGTQQIFIDNLRVVYR